METNRKRLDRLCMEDDVDTIMNFAEDEVCAICDREIEKNLSPQSPSCEGRWCDEAVELWLDKEAKEEEDHDR